MNNEDKLHLDMAQQARAEALLREPLLMEILGQIEDDLMRAWRTTGVNATEDRERLWQAVNILGKIPQHLHTIVANGSLARREIEEIAKLRIARPKVA